MRREPPKILRCAIYTRVSTDHGLEQEFNSLDNQREAAEAYIKSQAHEGWRGGPTRYDDGGFSGGSLDRPALQRLLSDVRAGLIDIIVVYKVDRLTRSLADFAKLVELFDAHGVSFVSVTQAFNTTNSMGRLTLNVLLSFAQFEREVTGERIRDKIAASKRKGLWMGGHVPFGYRVESRKLVIDPDEASTVRLIFERYLALGSLPALQQEMRDKGVVTRKRGQAVGGIAFTNGPLAHLLRNRIYLGEINHKGHSHKGEHEAIIPDELFEAVQNRLSRNHHDKRLRIESGALLLGRLADDRGHPMTPSHTQKGARRYRYYVSSVLAQGRKDEAGSVARVSAPEIEAAVVSGLKRALGDSFVGEALRDQDLVERHLIQVIIGQGGLEIAYCLSEGGPLQRQTLAWSSRPMTRRREVIAPTDKPDIVLRPIRSEARAKLLESIVKARAWLDELISTPDTTTDTIAEREGCSERFVRQTLNLAFLSPALVKAAVDGTLPRGCGVSKLADPPLDWREQTKLMLA
ncbi:recombinase family protein [Microvirga pudoricolor]|uniref:recombinase family protein n=1 Tax=Microvirga pudoricolor TaxID=2778729 RepID=UPI00194F6171|nr:recombinase family protein [Microvirga pudoricolor]MBM6595050.1 recombinase family protein [Microvirga pudoricolor]